MKYLLVVLSVIFLLFSCHDNENELQQTDFYALAVGNSWVYKNFAYNSQTETYEDSGVIDFISIIGTENIQGNMYYKFRVLTTGNENNHPRYFNDNGEHFYFRRNDNGNLVNESNNIIFTNNNYEERELSSIVNANLTITIYEQLQNEIHEITTDVGVFSCIYSKKYARNSINNAIYPGIDEVNYTYGIGLIHDSNSFISSENPMVKRYLISYNVQ